MPARDSSGSSLTHASTNSSLDPQGLSDGEAVALTKTVTAVAVMELVEAGKLKLDDSIGTYLDGLPDRWRGVTIRQMLSHTSGLPDIVKSGTPDAIAGDIARKYLESSGGHDGAFGAKD